LMRAGVPEIDKQRRTVYDYFEFVGCDRDRVGCFGDVPAWCGPVFFRQGPGVIFRGDGFCECGADADEIWSKYRDLDLRVVLAVKCDCFVRLFEPNNRTDLFERSDVLRVDASQKRENYEKSFHDVYPPITQITQIFMNSSV
jgi:hypothetical protein